MVPERTHIFSIILYIPQTASKKFVSLIHSMKLLSPELPLYPYQFIIPPFSKYSCYVWAGAYTCYLHMLFKLQKQVCQTVGPRTY